MNRGLWRQRQSEQGEFGKYVLRLQEARARFGGKISDKTESFGILTEIMI